MTLSTDEHPADISIKLNYRHTFKVNRAKLSRFSPVVQSLPTSETTLQVESPFEEAFLQVLLYAVYQDSSIISRFNTSNERTLELYAAAHVLGLDVDSKISDLILQRAELTNVSAYIQYHAWSRHYIDFEFVIKLLGLQGRGAPYWNKGKQLLDWLGEKNFTRAEEADELLESDDFKKVRRYLKSKQLNLPNLYELFQGYPVASEAVTLHSLFSGSLS
jgi:hypothetical protein